MTTMNEGEEREEENRESVVLSSIHQAMGLEWQVVLMLWCAEGMLPLARALKEPDGEEEERRLFYVAVTRAKDQLIRGGCFAIALDRLRSHSAYQGQWSRLRFSVLA